MIPLNIFPLLHTKNPILGAFAKLQKRLLAMSYLSVCLFLRMEQLGYHGMNFPEI
jgi:hypothetical protein